jgi:hypothetical protein
LTVTPGVTTTYWVRTSGWCGPVTDSVTVTVTVCQPVGGVSVADATPVYPNGTSQLNANATGSNLTYQWYRGASGDTTHPVSGATSATVSLVITSTDTYWVRVSGGCSAAVNSNAAFMSAYPNITLQPSSLSLVSGSTARFSVTAAGTYLTYQWYRNGSIVTGATVSSITTPALTAANTYSVVVTSGRASATSTTATASMCTGVTIDTVFSTSLGSCKRITVSAPGADQYQWFHGAAGDTSSLMTTGLDAYVDVCTAGQYWCRAEVTDGNGNVTCYVDGPVSNIQ